MLHWKRKKSYDKDIITVKSGENRESNENRNENLRSEKQNDKKLGIIFITKKEETITNNRWIHGIVKKSREEIQFSELCASKSYYA